MSTDSRVAVKLAYDGLKFYGYQRQPGRRTVEGDLMDALATIGAAGPGRAAGFRSSSRTDRGVSALGNVISFRTNFPLDGLCGAINSKVDDIWAYAAAEVPSDFNPRWARERWYRYHLPRHGQDVAVMRELLSRFEGAHDFSAFSRKDGRNPVRTIDSIEVIETPGFILVDLRAESFLWNMVRRIIWMVDSCSKGEMDERFVGPRARKQPRRVGLAPPENLFLMDVDCGVDFGVDAKSSGRLRKAFGGRLEACSVAQEFSRHMLDILEPCRGCEH